MMQRLWTVALSVLCACPSEAPDTRSLLLHAGDVPGLWVIEANGFEPDGDWSFTCDDGLGGAATVLEGQWLGARDAAGRATRCALIVGDGDGQTHTSGSVTLTPDLLETQRRLLDPAGDSGLDRFEAKALATVLAEPLDPAIDLLAWRVADGLLVVKNNEGKRIWRRVWNEGVLTTVLAEEQGEDPCGSGDDRPFDLTTGLTQLNRDDAPAAGYARADDPRLMVYTDRISRPHCVARLFGLFDAPTAPDLYAVPHPAVSRGAGFAGHGDLSAIGSNAALFAWGAGVGDTLAGEALRQVDIAPTVASALGVRTMLGRAADGALAETILARQDGVVRTDLLAPDSAELVIILTFDGFGAWGAQGLVDELPAFSRMAEEGVHDPRGVTSGFPSYTLPGHNTLGSGMWSGHHGIWSNVLIDRADGSRVDFVGDFFRNTEAWWRGGETLHHALLNRPPERIPQPWTVSVGSPSFLGAVTDALAFTGPAAEAWVNIGREPIYQTFPQPPEWAEGSTAAAWEGSIMFLEYVRRLANGQINGERPHYIIANLPITDLVGEQYGPHSDRTLVTYQAMDFMVGRLLDDIALRGLDDRIAVIVTADHGMVLGDPERPMPSGWANGNPWTDRGVVATNVNGAIYIHALRYERRIESGFVNLTVASADLPNRGLAGVTCTLYRADGSVDSERIGDAEGAVSFPVPADQTIYGVLRAEGYSDLRLAPADLRQ
jgi:hypothetical protein